MNTDTITQIIFKERYKLIAKYPLLATADCHTTAAAQLHIFSLKQKNSPLSSKTALPRRLI